MSLYMHPWRAQMLKSSVFMLRGFASSSPYNCRQAPGSTGSVFNTDHPISDCVKQKSQLGVNTPIKLGICRLAGGQLRTVSTSHRTAHRQRHRGLFQTRRHALCKECAFAFAVTDQPTSLSIYDNTDHDLELNEEEVSHPRLNCDSKIGSDTDRNVELPVLFSVETRTYHHALDVITAARDAGDLCNSAATKLNDLCHLMHVESIIQSAAKPHGKNSDDIIIRSERRSNKADHEFLYFIRSDDDHVCTSRDISLFNTVESTPLANPCRDLSSQTVKNVAKPTTASVTEMNADGEVGRGDLTTVLLAPSLGNVMSFVGDDHTLFAEGEENGLAKCTQGQEMNKNDADSPDGPSKEQLAYMHLRLSEEMPRFFEQSHDYGLYADHIHFDNRIMKVSTRGLPAYRATVQSLKYLSTACLMQTQMEVLRITMEAEQGCIQARWRIRGVPVHSYILRPWGKKHNHRYFDAFSTFHIGNDGLIHAHVLDKVVPSSENKVKVTSWAVRLGIMLGLVRPPAFDPDVMKAMTLMKAILESGKMS